MTDCNGQTGFVGQFLQLHFPNAQAPTIAASSIDGDQEALGLGIEPFPFMTPPAPNRGHGKGAGVMIGSDIDETGVAPNIVNAMTRQKNSWVSSGSGSLPSE
jgi:hypothetical protein